MTTLLSGLRLSVPAHLKRCDQCLKYHSSSPDLQYTWMQPSGVELQSVCVISSALLAMLARHAVSGVGIYAFRIGRAEDVVCARHVRAALSNLGPPIVEDAAARQYQIIHPREQPW